MLSSGAISWSSKKQPIVTWSSTEAEYVAAVSGACQVVWLKVILEHLGVENGESISIMCDNTSAIKLSQNPVFHGRSRHIHVRYHYLRELVNEGIIELLHCYSEEQVADIMTKPVKAEAFVKFRRMMGMCKLENVS